MSDTKIAPESDAVQPEDAVMAPVQKKKSIYDVFSTNANLEQSGVWLDYGELGRFKTLRAGGANRAFSAAMLKKMQPYRRILQAKQNRPDQQTIEMVSKIQMEVFAETVVIGWENVPDADGNMIPYSKAACLKLFQDLPAFFEDLSQYAQDIANFQNEGVEADAKN